MLASYWGSSKVVYYYVRSKSLCKRTIYGNTLFILQHRLGCHRSWQACTVDGVEEGWCRPQTEFPSIQLWVKGDAKLLHGSTVGHNNVTVQAWEGDVGEDDIVSSCEVRECTWWSQPRGPGTRDSPFHALCLADSTVSAPTWLVIPSIMGKVSESIKTTGGCNTHLMGTKSLLSQWKQVSVGDTHCGTCQLSQRWELWVEYLHLDELASPLTMLTFMCDVAVISTWSMLMPSVSNSHWVAQVSSGRFANVKKGVTQISCQLLTSTRPGPGLVEVAPLHWSLDIFLCTHITTWGSAGWHQHEPCLAQHGGGSSICFLSMLLLDPWHVHRTLQSAKQHFSHPKFWHVIWAIQLLHSIPVCKRLSEIFRQGL